MLSKQQAGTKQHTWKLIKSPTPWSSIFLALLDFESERSFRALGYDANSKKGEGLTSSKILLS